MLRHAHCVSQVVSDRSRLTTDMASGNIQHELTRHPDAARAGERIHGLR